MGLLDSMSSRQRPALASGRIVVLAALAFQGFTLAINGIAAPWMMQGFGIDEAGIARAFGWISLSAFGAFALARHADRVGRRPVIIGSIAVGCVSALGAALAHALIVFMLFDVLLLSAAGAAMASSVVWIAESSAREDRAANQGLAGLALFLGSGPCALLMPWLARTEISWRALLWLSASQILLVPFLLRLSAKEVDWSGPAPARQPDARVHLFDRAHRSRATALIVTGILSTVATGGVESWRYFHIVRGVGFTPAVASALLVAAGITAVAGFTLGAIASDRLGRARSVAGFQVVMCCAIAWSFWGPPGGSPHPWLWLAGGFTIAAVTGNAITVAANTTISELFPPTLRATMFGVLYLAGAIGRVAAQVLVAVAAPRVGGVSIAVGCLALVGLPAAAIFLWAIPETRVRPIGLERGRRTSRAAPSSLPAYAALSAGGLLAALVAVEGAVRVVAPRAVMVPWQDDIRGITAPMPEVRGRFAIRDRFDTTVTIHRRFRGRRQVAVNPAPGTIRIAVLGDSFTFGWGAEDDETYPALLERRLTTSGASGRATVEVLNAGVINTGTGEQALWYDAWVKQFTPSVVVLTMLWNDVDDDVRGGFFERTADGRIQPRTSPILDRGLSTLRAVRAFTHAAPGFPWLAQHSELLAWLREAPTNLLVATRAHAMGGRNLADVTADRLGSEDLAIMRGEIRWLRERLPAGTRLAIVFLPGAEAFDRARRGAAAVVGKSAQIVTTLHEISREDGVPFLDLGPVLGRDASPAHFYFEKDPHPNAAGYAAIANAVASWLAEQGLVARQKDVFRAQNFLYPDAADVFLDRAAR